MRVALGADVNGYRMKEAIRGHLASLGHDVVDFGGAEGDELDYPDVAVPVTRAVAAGEVDRAVLICGTGLGMAIVANKVPGVRAAPVTDPYSAERAIKSNNAQVLCLGAKVVGVEVAELLLDHWMGSDFAGGASARKVAKIEAMDAVRAEVRP